MKRYRVRVTERHVDYVWITAEDRDLARDQAHVVAECVYESLDDCEIVDEQDVYNEE